MIDTDKYTGHTPAPWVVKNSPLHVTHLYGRNNRKICSIQTPDGMFAKTKDELKLSRECNTNAQLIIDAPLLLAEVERLREELNKQMEYIEWLEQFAPKAGEHNTSWEAYELAKGSEEE